jgi:hypothetical protein
MIKFIENIGDYFSSNYFDEDFSSKVLAKCGYATDDIKEFNKKITPVKDRFFKFKQLYIEGKLRTKDKIKETHLFHTSLLNALGFDGNSTNYKQLFHISENEAIPVRHILYRGDRPHLMIMEMQALIKEDEKDPDGLFEQRYNVEEELQSNPAQKYHRSQWEDVFKVPEGIKISPVIINKAISELFLMEQHLRPKYILLLAGNAIFLLEQEKWFRGSYLQFDLEELFTEATANPRANYNALFYFLTSKEALSPESNMVLLDQLDEDSHKSAYEVTKDLKEGIIHAVEALANEAIWYHYHLQAIQDDLDETDDNFEQEVKDDCLRIIYRLLFVFYAESREDLDVLPSNDPVYNRGYSMEMLRDLEQVPLNSETSLNGYFFHESLSKLFHVLSSGYREKENGNNKSFKVRHIDSPIFDDGKLNHLHKVKFRNKVWQDIICRLSLSKQQKGKNRGRISYANLGINQLGSVYESLLAYRGFYAEQDYIEVHKKDKAQEGTYLVPRSRRDDFEEGEILKDTSNGEDVILKKGTFVYRLSGRDRQKSASYYTPEVLTQSTVKYTLKPILERLEQGEMKAIELLDLKLLEPAMGAAAFQNEMINQLAEAYLSYRQKELRDFGRVEWKVEPDKYKEELQKVKAYIATNNTYGVDLNPTAVELGKLSLWLNVIHKEMETPFFSNRICVGNAVVGAWLKVYKVNDIAQELDKNGRPLSKQPKNEWWESAPRQLEFKAQTDYAKIKHGRKPDEIYHFLLPDKNMVPSAGIKMLKEESPEFARGVAEWKKDWIKPLNKSETEKLQLLSSKIDELLTEYYQFQLTIASQTRTRQNIFGATKANEQFQISMRSYDEKERLADQRNRHSAPYFKLKMVMDYWCSLWFWDVRDAVQLPNRNQYWNDIASILQLDTNAAVDGIIVKRGQQSLYESASQLSMVMDSAGETLEPSITNAAADFVDAVVEYTNRKDLFDNNQRLSLVSQLAKKYFFFHPQLEFLEVFWERGGFDLMAGNPPWVNIEFDNEGFISSYDPLPVIKSYSSPEINIEMENISKRDKEFSELLINELIEVESFRQYVSSIQNYQLLFGQKPNLYKSIIENSLLLINKKGYCGLLHPQGLYDDPFGDRFRIVLYKRLKYHFQFQNELKLFAEIGNRNVFSINIYSGSSTNIDFQAIFSLFHPSTIEGCFIETNNDIELRGIKAKNNFDEFVWNIVPNANRLIHFESEIFERLTTAFETNGDIGKIILPSFFNKELLNILIKLATFSGKVSNKKSIIPECWNETRAVATNIIKRKTTFPIYDSYECIFSGPFFFINNPLYQTPKKVCETHRAYEIIDLTQIDNSFWGRTNYVPSEEIEIFRNRIEGFDESKPWIDHYKVFLSKMLSPSGERTLQPSLVPPKLSHTNGVASITFQNEKDILEFLSITSSLILDFYIKLLRKTNLYDNTIKDLPFGIEDKYLNHVFVRVLMLNCLNEYYSSIWSNFYDIRWNNYEWSKSDLRLKSFGNLDEKWNWAIPLRNAFERRFCSVEIDVIIAHALGLNLEDLIYAYLVQFPVLQENEDDTWYDTKGNIVFTCSKGLVGVGLDRKEWEQVRNLPAGETYEHTITKSELYQGKKITYYAPFDKCDRVEDYKVAWGHFEGIFKEK